VEDHLVLQAVVGNLPQVTLLGGVKFPGDDQPAPRGKPPATQPRPGVEQQVEPFVVADQPEEKHVIDRRIQPQPYTSLVAGDPLPEVLEKRMRGKQRRGIAVCLQFAVHLLGHVDEPVHDTQVITVEGFVGQVVLVGFDVVDLAEHLRMVVAAGETGNGAETGCHEGRPVFHQHEIGTFAAYPATDTHPVERVDRIDAPADVQIGRRRRGYGLALAREEQRRVLQRESLYVDLVPTPLKGAGHDLHDRSQSAPVRVRRA